jgi:hypothetical protein
MAGNFQIHQGEIVTAWRGPPQLTSRNSSSLRFEERSEVGNVDFTAAVRGRAPSRSALCDPHRLVYNAGTDAKQLADAILCNSTTVAFRDLYSTMSTAGLNRISGNTNSIESLA